MKLLGVETTVHSTTKSRKLYFKKSISKMVKLTTELINSCMQYINPCRDRELDLRGNDIKK